MKTADETLAEFAKSEGVEFYASEYDAIISAMKDYAMGVAFRALQDASENATASGISAFKCYVNKKSITETEIKLP